ncbi:hypothetical protein [Klebsiella sp. PL-2018]|uniref:hypothetical protein n=1 Tax=Klebsiella sp. PL-2018 TaxID=2851540 RepID=UPI001C78015E|nr:hypothetical protein [Klebsiella sp. PL-2018]QXD00410.1 hypothetical protein MKleb_4909 [Klebsiella sp. PL-2018]
MLPQPLTGRMGGEGAVLKTTPLLQGTTLPLKFLRTVIFLIAENSKETINYGKTT